MENWGLIICGTVLLELLWVFSSSNNIIDEDAMLIDNENCSFKNKIDVAYIISHEMAHQWLILFFNLT